MITLHKAETARQNNTLSIFFETPQNFTNHFFRGAHVLLRGAELPLHLHFTFMHLADAFIQSDLQCIQAIHFFNQYVCSLGIEPTTFCAANAMLYH